MMSNLFMGYLVAGEKEFLSYIQNQKDKCNYGKNIDKGKLMMLTLNKYKRLCMKENGIYKSPEEQYILALSAELDNLKDSNLKLSTVFKSKGTPNLKTSNQVSQKRNKKKPKTE